MGEILRYKYALQSLELALYFKYNYFDIEAITCFKDLYFFFVLTGQFQNYKIININNIFLIIKVHHIKLEAIGVEMIL